IARRRGAAPGAGEPHEPAWRPGDGELRGVGPDRAGRHQGGHRPGGGRLDPAAGVSGDRPRGAACGGYAARRLTARLGEAAGDTRAGAARRARPRHPPPARPRLSRRGALGAEDDRAPRWEKWPPLCTLVAQRFAGQTISPTRVIPRREKYPPLQIPLLQGVTPGGIISPTHSDRIEGERTIGRRSWGQG